MKRKWNWPIWVGFVVAVGGLFSYEFFVQFPITRDFPWANLLLFGIGAALLLARISSRVWPAATLSRQDFRFDLCRDRLVLCWRSSPTKFFTSCDKCRFRRRRREIGQKAPDFTLAGSKRKTGWH